MVFASVIVLSCNACGGGWETGRRPSETMFRPHAFVVVVDLAGNGAVRHSHFAVTKGIPTAGAPGKDVAFETPCFRQSGHVAKSPFNWSQIMR